MDSNNNNNVNKESVVSPLNISPSSSLSSSFSNSSRQSTSVSSSDKSSDSSSKQCKTACANEYPMKLEKIDEKNNENNPVKAVKTSKKFSFGFGKKLRNFLTSNSDKNRNLQTTGVNCEININTKIDKLTSFQNNFNLKGSNIEDIRVDLQNKLKYVLIFKNV